MLGVFSRFFSSVWSYFINLCGKQLRVLGDEETDPDMMRITNITFMFEYNENFYGIFIRANQKLGLCRMDFEGISEGVSSIFIMRETMLLVITENGNLYSCKPSKKIQLVDGRFRNRMLIESITTGNADVCFVTFGPCVSLSDRKEGVILIDSLNRKWLYYRKWVSTVTSGIDHDCRDYQDGIKVFLKKLPSKFDSVDILFYQSKKFLVRDSVGIGIFMKKGADVELIYYIVESKQSFFDNSNPYSTNLRFTLNPLKPTTERRSLDGKDFSGLYSSYKRVFRNGNTCFRHVPECANVNDNFYSIKDQDYYRHYFCFAQMIHSLLEVYNLKVIKVFHSNHIEPYYLLQTSCRKILFFDTVRDVCVVDQLTDHEILSMDYSNSLLVDKSGNLSLLIIDSYTISERHCQNRNKNFVGEPAYDDTGISIIPYGTIDSYASVTNIKSARK